MVKDRQAQLYQNSSRHENNWLDGCVISKNLLYTLSSHLGGVFGSISIALEN